MSFLRQALAAAAVTAWFAIWTIAARRLSSPADAAPFRLEWLEAVFLTGFAALWFESLGHGEWWVLFVVVGLMIEGPMRLRHRADVPFTGAPWRPVLFGTLRLLGAGLVLSLLL